MLTVIFLLALQAQATTPLAAQAPPPHVSIPRIEGETAVDGVLDEAAWSKAARLSGFSQYQPSDGRPAEEQTDVLVWYSPDAIHFGIVAHDANPSSIRATVADRDNLDREDHVTIYLDTFHDRRRAFFFAVNPLGAQQDGVQNEGQFSAGNTFGGSVDKSPDYQFDSKGHITAEGYTIEVRIPFKSLRYPGSGPQTWGLNIKRKIQRTGYEDTWTDARRVASFLAQSGTIDGLHDLERGVVTEVQPFVTGSSDGTRTPSGDFSRAAADLNAGANLRLGFTNLSVDATVNPDFSQVESDAGLITVNQRFALFVAEKRPFFLEGIELFSTPNQLVYTRRIVDPVAGGKVTGKFGPVGVAHLTAVDDTPDGNAVFNVTRIRRDFGRSSVAGVTLTDRSGEGPFNRVLAADARIVFKRLYYVLGQIGGSWTGAAADGGLGTASDDGRSAPIWTMEFDRTARKWGFNYKLNAIGEDFESAAGFVPRTNVVEAHAFNRVSFYGARGAWLESVSAFFGPSRLWTYDGFGRDAPIEGGESVNMSANLRGGWQVSNSYQREFVTFHPDAYASYTVAGDDVTTPFSPADELTGALGVTASVTTPTWQKVNAKFEVSRNETAIFPEAAEGLERRYSVTLGARPTTSLRLDLTAVHSTIDRTRDGSEFARTILPRVKLEYQPKRSFFFRVVGEYRAQRQAALEDPRTGRALFVGGLASQAEEVNGLRLDWLASFEPTPGTAAYFGYGSAMDSPTTFGVNDLRRTNDGFFVKLAYQFRR